MAIIFGTTMQGRESAVPKELYLWLILRNSKYPLINFQIEVFKPINEEEEISFKRLTKYSIIYNRKPLGVDAVIFPYPNAKWIVRIIGGKDERGDIVEIGKTKEPLGIVLRREISGVPAEPTSDMEQIDKWVWGVIRKDGGSSDKPEMMPVSPDGEWTSKFSITGQQLKDAVESHRDELRRTVQGDPKAINGFVEELKIKSDESRGRGA